MSTVAALAEVIRRRLYAGNNRSRYNFLAAGISTTDTTVTFEDTTDGIEQGGTIAIGAELLYVRSVNKAAKTATVVRGFTGSTPAAASIGATVEVAPRFWLGDVIDTMAEEIRSWPPSLFQVKTLDVEVDSAARAYDLDGENRDVLYLLEVLVDSDELGNFRMSDASWGERPAVLIRDPNRATFASGQGVQMQARPARSGTIRVTYALGFDGLEIAATDDLTEDLRIPEGWYDIIRYGTMWRMMSHREVGRTDPQAAGESRRDEGVPPGYISQTTNSLLKLRDRRIADEEARLRARWPYKA